MSLLTIYVTKPCPRCHALMSLFDRWGQGYLSCDLGAEAIADMRCEGHFGLSAPVLLVDGVYHGPEEFFQGDKLDETRLRELIA